MEIYNKLVRDKIPQIIEERGSTPNFKALDDTDYAQALNIKLQEELDEYFAANGDDQIDELADLVEVIYAALEHKGVSVEELEKRRILKKEQRGAFLRMRLLLISVQ